MQDEARLLLGSSIGTRPKNFSEQSILAEFMSARRKSQCKESIGSAVAFRALAGGDITHMSIIPAHCGQMFWAAPIHPTTPASG